jgi:hypothetical protein
MHVNKGCVVNLEGKKLERQKYRKTNQKGSYRNERAVWTGSTWLGI